MAEQNEQFRVTVFGGASGGPGREGLRTFQAKWKEVGEDWNKLDPLDVEKLDAMWLAADIGRVLAQHNWQLKTGGYDFGTMGMVNRSTVAFGRKAGSEVKPVGVPYNSELLPEDPFVKAEIEEVTTIGQRLDGLLNAEAFVVLRGENGTLNGLRHWLKMKI